MDAKTAPQGVTIAREFTMLVYQDGRDTPAKAQARAWNAVAALWNRQQGTRTSGALCAGCGKPLNGEADVLLLPYGERAHTGNGYSCIHAYGRRWRREAAAALAAIGIPTPAAIMAEAKEVTRDTSQSATECDKWR